MKKTKRGPRAIAVVEFLPGGMMRLVPIALWMDGRYYDASLYGANPVPMAVEPETVYEAESFGEPTGTFTIGTPQQVNGSWVADGSWRPHLAMDEKVSAQAAKDAANKPKANPNNTVMTGDANDGRPVLKRAPGSGGDAPGSSAPPPATANDSDRPTMKRPPGDSSSKPTAGDDSTGSATSTAKTQTTVDDQDPNRPVMKRPTATAASSGSSASDSNVTSVAPAPSSNDNDPNRPVLSRNPATKPKNQVKSDLPMEKTAMSASASVKGARAYPAISDAGDYHGRSMLYAMSPGERTTQEQQILKVAMDEIRAFAAKRNGPAVPKTATITEYDVRAFDLDYSSSPTIVLTAKLPVTGAKTPPDFSYFVTIVARVDINDQPQKIFTVVSDSQHLDAYPRLELIDALDADANGRGDLLFRQYSDSGITYTLYRVSAYQLDKIFEGGSAL